MNPGKINVLVVEDSPVVRMLLTHLLAADPLLHVVGAVCDGQEAVEFVSSRKPDVILMDANMPRMDGYEATRTIMETQPVPIVISSASTKNEEVGMTFRALEAGAVAFVEKPGLLGSPGFDEAVRKLVQTVKLMAEVKVVRRWTRSRMAAQTAAGPAAAARPGEPVQMVAIGASTGGPPVIQGILRSLPKPYPIPILIVQHIAAGFLDGMVEWLAKSASLPVQLAVHGAVAAPGHVYLAPDGFHLGVMGGGRLLLSKDAPENGLRPSVAFLFRSVADVCGAQAVGVLLSGMGKDGAQELKLMRDKGAVTIAQDAESSVVHSMPGEAIQLGAAMYVLPPDRISATLAGLAGPP